MPLSLDAHNLMLDSLAGSAGFAALATCTRLNADPSGSTISTDRALAVGDAVSLNNLSDASRHAAEVTGDNGNGTFEIDPAPPASTFVSGDLVGHAPRVSADVVGPTGTDETVAITWAAAAAESVGLAQSESFNVDGGNSIGSFALYGDSTRTAFYGSFLTTSVETFGAAGSYELTQADVNLSVRYPDGS